MSFPRYPKYKPSGVEWLGDVPEGWEVKPLRYVCYCLDGSRVPLNSAQRAEKQGDVPYWGANSIMDYVDEALFDEDLVLLGEDGAPFFDKLKPIAFFSQGRVWPNNHVHVLRPVVTGTAKFITHALNITDFAHFIDGSTRDKLTQGSMKEIPLPFPPLPEQTAIAEFLDRETGKIDGLVAEQRRLMELLKEKRQAVISQAVTKGLNPRAPMKPSGVEWLGDVPRHWEVWKLTHSFKTIGSGTTPKTDNRDYYENGVIPWVNTGDLNDSFLADCENKITGSARKENPTLRMYPAGSVVIAMYGATIGKLAILKFAACVNQACCVFADREKIDYKFLFYWLLAYRSQIISLASGGGQPNISQNILRRLRVARPALEEQNAIVAYIDRETLKYDSLTAESLRTIDMLLERRAALISAAVTGQIDVRNSLRN